MTAVRRRNRNRDRHRDRQLACQQLVELVTDHLDGALDPATRAAVEQHLAACEDCAAYLEQVRRVLVLAGTGPPVTGGPDLGPDLAPDLGPDLGLDYRPDLVEDLLRRFRGRA